MYTYKVCIDENSPWLLKMKENEKTFWRMTSVPSVVKAVYL